MNPMGGPFMTVDDAAAYLRVSTKTIRRWIADGRLTLYKLDGGWLRLKIAEVDGLAKKQKPPRRADPPAQPEKH